MQFYIPETNEVKNLSFYYNGQEEITKEVIKEKNPYDMFQNTYNKNTSLCMTERTFSQWEKYYTEHDEYHHVFDVIANQEKNKQNAEKAKEDTAKPIDPILNPEQTAPFAGALLKEHAETGKDINPEKPNPKYDKVDILLAETNRETVEMIENGSFPLMQTKKNVPYVKNPFTNEVYKGLNQMRLQMSNDAHEQTNINYAPLTDVFRQKWSSNTKNAWGTVMYCGKDENGNAKYIVTVPTRGLNQHVFNENPQTQPALLKKQGKPLPEGTTTETFLTNEYARYMQSAFSKESFKASPSWKNESVKKTIIADLGKDPTMLARVCKNGYDLSHTNQEDKKREQGRVVPQKEQAVTKPIEARVQPIGRGR